MNRLKYLKEQRENKAADMDVIKDLCEKETRARTPEEKTRWQNLKKEVDTLDEEIKDLEEDNARDMRTAKPVGQNRTSTDKQEGRTFVDSERNFSIISKETSLVRPEHKNEIGLGELISIRLAGPKNDQEARSLSTALDASGGIQTSVSRSFWDRTRKLSALFNAGAQAVDYERSDSGIHKIPIITGLPTVAFKTENEDGVFSDPTFSNHPLDFETLFGVFQVSNEAISDGGPMLAQMIETSLANAFAQEIDRAGLFGTGTPPEPLGLNGMGILEFDMGDNGQDLANYAPLVGAIRLLMDNGLPLSEVGPFVMSPRSWQDLNLLATATELAPLPLPRGIQDIPWVVANSLPVNQTVGSSSDGTTIFVGNWSEFIVAFRLSLKIKFYDQPLAKAYATMVQAAARVDFAVQNPAHFVKISGITGADADIT